MTEHKSMNTVIHAAFRRDLARFDRALESIPSGSRTRAAQLGTAWDNLEGQLHHHHQDEETIFWPVMRELGADDALVDELDGEHKQMLAALDSATVAMTALRQDPTTVNIAAAREGIADLRDVVETHLSHEERDLEPFGEQHHDAPQMKAAQTAVRKAHKGGVGTFFTWLLDGADADAVAGLRREVPAPVLRVVVAVAGRDYRREVGSVWR
jgi:hemerythrin-like domain-containing protein